MIALALVAALLLLAWIVLVELRLKAAKILGEIVAEDFYERGKISEIERDAVCGQQAKGGSHER